MPTASLIRISQAARKLSLGTETIVNYLNAQGHAISHNPNAKLTTEQFQLLKKKFAHTAFGKTTTTPSRAATPAVQKNTTQHIAFRTIPKLNIIGKQLQTPPIPKPQPAAAVPKPIAPQKTIPTPVHHAKRQLINLTFLGKMKLPPKKKMLQVASSDRIAVTKRTSRAPLAKPHTLRANKPTKSFRRPSTKRRRTLSKYERAQQRKQKRQSHTIARHQAETQSQQAAKVLQLTTQISVKDLAALMKLPVNQVLSTCMDLGIIATINQRLDASTITLLAEENGYKVNFDTPVSPQHPIEATTKTKQIPRPPIVTVMGHVDHGKTSLLDYIRKTKLTAQEVGGITQSIGAYHITTPNDQQITFLDTPGHEAFTAMRARGAQIADIVILIIAADDSVMPQTKEAIQHAKLANIPIIIAVNKIDKPGVNTEKIKQELAGMDITIEAWGGAYQYQEISAKTGQGIDQLLEKILLEAEMLNLTANPEGKATGTIIEATLDKNKGYIATAIVSQGTLHPRDTLYAGAYHGKIKALFDYKGALQASAPPAIPVQLLGLNGPPQAGDTFIVTDTIKQAQQHAAQYKQRLHQQTLRTKYQPTVDQALQQLGNKEAKTISLILKGNTQGAVQALADTLLALSTSQTTVQVLHQAVGPITDSDVLLAAASQANIIGFQTQSQSSTEELAAKEKVTIQHYNIIYDAVAYLEKVVNASSTQAQAEKILGRAEVRHLFKISKIGTIAGCYITEGKINRNQPIRIIRDNTVIYTGHIKQIKREKEETTEVAKGYECGINIHKYNDIQLKDIIENFTLVTS